MPSVLLADDHAVVRHGLRQILVEDYPDAIFGEARDTGEAITLAQSQPWDLLILDISLPGRSGLEALREIRQLCPKLPILVFSVHSEGQYAVRVLKAGAAGFINKGSSREELQRAVQRVLSGGKYISTELAEALASDLNLGAEKPPHQSLSDREYEVMRGLAAGKTISFLATELSLSIKTISTYRRRVLEKMHMSSNAELVRYALENQMLEP